MAIIPYDEVLDQWIKNITAKWNHFDFKKMFGGVCYLLKGNMVCGVYKEFLILRLGEENALRAMKETYTQPFNITGRSMKGWVMLSREGFTDDQKLKNWIEKAKKFVDTLPPK